MDDHGWSVKALRTVLILQHISSENHTSNKWPNHRPSGFPDQSVLGPSSW